MSEKKVEDYSKSVLAEFINSQFYFTGEELYGRLNRIERNQHRQLLLDKSKRLSVEMEKVSGSMETLGEYCRLMDEHSAIIEELHKSY
jgi:midasin (ATPase involved in ribosome maturation)